MNNAPQAWTRIRSKYESGTAIAMLTAYDCPTAQIAQEAGIDILLVGDSVGTNVLGYSSVHEVTMDDMCHHTQAVSRGASDTYVLGDMPSGSYTDPKTACRNAARFLEAGADGVKLEGPFYELIEQLAQSGIQTTAHLGLTPQFHSSFKLQACTAEDALTLLQQAQDLEKAGASMLVLELVPQEVAKLVTEGITIPTIGIGAGRFTSGQVQVVHDLLGITPKAFRHAGRYTELRSAANAAMQSYLQDVQERAFPKEQNTRHMPADELERLIQELRRK